MSLNLRPPYDVSAVHGNASSEINAITTKGTPIGADVLLIEDSADTFSKKKVLISSLPSSSSDKYVYIPCEPNSNFNNQRTRALGSSANYRFNFAVPNDFVSLVSAVLIMTPGATNATADIDLDSNYGAIGQSPTTHVESNSVLTYNITAGIKFGINIATVLTNLGAGDTGGVLVTHNGIGGTSEYEGILIRYN